MARDQQFEEVISVRVSKELKERITVHQDNEHRHSAGEMARILLMEALDARTVKDKRTKAKK